LTTKWSEEHVNVREGGNYKPRRQREWDECV